MYLLQIDLIINTTRRPTNTDTTYLSILYLLYIGITITTAQHCRFLIPTNEVDT